MKKHLPTVARYLLGFIYTIFGLNGFLHFIPVPPPSEMGGAFLGALANTGYFFPFLKATEVVGGLMLLSGMFVPLALVILASVTLNIFLYHALLDPAGVYLPILMLVTHLYLGFCAYCTAYKPLFQKKTEPCTAKPQV